MNVPPTHHAKITSSEWLVLILLACINFVHTMDFVMVIPMGPILIKQLHISASQVGHIVSSYTISAAIFGLITAGYIDKIERKKALICSFAGLLLGTFYCSFSSNYTELLVARAFAGASGGVMSSLIYAYIGDFIAQHKRGEATGIVMNSHSIAYIMGIPLGLVIVSHYSWNTPFIFLAVLGSLLFILAIFKLPNIPPPPNLHNKPIKEVYKFIFTYPNSRWALIFMMLITVAGFAIIPFISTFVIFNAGLPEHLLIYMYLISGVVNFFAGPAVGKLADKYGKTKLFTILASCSIFPILLFCSLNQAPIWLILTTTTLLFLFFAARYVPAITLISSSTEQEKRGGFLTISNSMQQMVMGISAFVGGVIITTHTDGSISGLYYNGIIAIIAILISLFVVKKIKIIS